MSDAPAPENTAGVVVTFNPDSRLPERVAALASQLGRVLIVDNASSGGAAVVVDGVARDPAVEVRRNERNVGVATALNQGAAWARERGYRWLLLLDQDSILEPGALAVLAEAWRAHPARERIAVIGSNFVDPNVGRLQYEAAANGASAWVERETVITAGSLLSLAALEVVGPLRDAFFIDHVDHEYCLRARARGFHVISARRPAMRHTVGAGRVHGRGWVATHHPPERWYFMLRNEAVLVREYFLREPRWVAITLVSRLKSLVAMLLFERQRGAKLRRLLAGLRDGLRGRLGQTSA